MAGRSAFPAAGPGYNYMAGTLTKRPASNKADMRKIGGNGRRWLVGFHLFLAAVWVGTAFAMNLITFINGATTNGDELYAANAAVKLLDDWLIIPAALGCLFTGLLLSLLTHWGFFRFRWVTVKWVMTVAFVLFGTFFLGPWTNEMTAIAGAERADAWRNEIYLYDRRMVMIFGAVQTLLLAVTLFITVFRPWGKKSKPAAGQTDG